MQFLGKSLIILFIILASSLGFASQLTTFGLGAKNQALVNSTSSLPIDAYSQSYNPALMSFLKSKEFSFSLQGAVTTFEKINQVLTDTTQLGGASNVTSDVSTKTPDTFALSVAYKQEINSQWNWGVVLNSPVEKVLSIDTEDTFVPQYSMYLSDTQRFNFGLNFSYKISEDWSLGVGGQLFLVTAGTAVFRMPSPGNSTARMKMDVRPGIAPVVGVTKSYDKFKTSVVYWGKQDGKIRLDNSSTINVAGLGTPLNFSGTTSVAYDPETFILSQSYEDDKDRIGFAAHWERWSDYTSSVMALSFQTFTGSFSQTLPDISFKDIISLHLGYEHKWLNWSLRGGYAFVPTPVPDQSGSTNFVDSDKHVLGLGVGLFKGALDIAAQIHYLTPKQVVKNSSQAIGYPGYKIGGVVYSYGLTWTKEI